MTEQTEINISSFSFAMMVLQINHMEEKRYAGN